MDFKLQPGKTLSGKRVILSNAENPHLYISGRSGSGKSYLIQKLVLQAANQGALVVVLDYTGDFLNFRPPENLHFQRVDVSSPDDFTFNPLIGLPGQNASIRAQQLLAALHSMFPMGR